MRFLRELAAELFGMFAGDGRLAIGVLAIAGAAALTSNAGGFRRISAAACFSSEPRCCCSKTCAAPPPGLESRFRYVS